jgi:hypothetical protein
MVPRARIQQLVLAGRARARHCGSRSAAAPRRPRTVAGKITCSPGTCTNQAFEALRVCRAVAAPASHRHPQRERHLSLAAVHVAQFRRVIDQRVHAARRRSRRTSAPPPGAARRPPLRPRADERRSPQIGVSRTRSRTELLHRARASRRTRRRSTPMSSPISTTRSSPQRAPGAGTSRNASVSAGLLAGRQPLAVALGPARTARPASSRSASATPRSAWRRRSSAASRSPPRAPPPPRRRTRASPRRSRQICAREISTSQRVAWSRQRASLRPLPR